MDVVGTILAFVVVIVLLVVVHEIGHFVAAKLAGITVQEFGVGFPPRLASVTWRGTRYSVNAIPLGGFVKMLGEDGEIEADRMRKRGMSEAAIERAMTGAFNRKPIWLRIIVLVAGVLMNFLLAVGLWSVASVQEQPELAAPITVTSVQTGRPAKGKLEPGDRIVAIDGQTFERAFDLLAYIQQREGTEVTLRVERDGKTINVAVTPERLTDEQRAANVGAIGFAWTTQLKNFPPIADSPPAALRAGLSEALQTASQIPTALGRTVLGLIGLAPNMGDARGPIGIAQITGEVIKQPFVVQIEFVALLSLNLAVLNVLPFPPLDGGRVAVVLLEAARRRRLPAEREALIYLTGFLVLITLVILISIQDIARLPGS
jgi:regulator of sigma E protease